MTKTAIDRLHAAKAPIDKLYAVGLNPPAGGWRSKDDFDMAMAATKKRHSLTFEQTIQLINAAHDAGLVAETPRPGAEKQLAGTFRMMLAAGIVPTGDIDHVYSVEEFDALLAERDLSPEQRIQIKENAFLAGILASGAVERPSVKPAAEKAAKLILARLDIESPKAGEKLNVRVVDKAIKDAGLSEQSVWIKTTLATAGWLA
jgi:hypothetical protein